MPIIANPPGKKPERTRLVVTGDVHVYHGRGGPYRKGDTLSVTPAHAKELLAVGHVDTAENIATKAAAAAKAAEATAQTAAATAAAAEATAAATSSAAG